MSELSLAPKKLVKAVKSGKNPEQIVALSQNAQKRVSHTDLLIARGLIELGGTANTGAPIYSLAVASGQNPMTIQTSLASKDKRGLGFFETKLDDPNRSNQSISLTLRGLAYAFRHRQATPRVVSKVPEIYHRIVEELYWGGKLISDELQKIVDIVDYRITDVGITNETVQRSIYVLGQIGCVEVESARNRFSKFTSLSLTERGEDYYLRCEEAIAGEREQPFGPYISKTDIL